MGKDEMYATSETLLTLINGGWLYDTSKTTNFLTVFYDMKAKLTLNPLQTGFESSRHLHPILFSPQARGSIEASFETKK